MSGPTLLVVAKEPVPGRVKTRLSPPWSPDDAAALAAAALHDTLAAVLAAPARRRVLLLDGEPGRWLPPGFEVWPQATGTLDVRLAAALDAGSGPTVLLGMDTPQVTPALLAMRGDTGDTGDAQFGPAADGGFWALGLREPDGALVRGVAMSRPTTGAAVLDRLRRSGRSVRLLRTLRDVDTAADARAVAASAPQTRFGRLHAQLLAEGPADRRAGVSAAPLEVFGALLHGPSGAGSGLRCADGRWIALDVDRWRAPADAADASVLDRCRGIVLDVGCGPGRLVAALAARGVPVMGVDVAPSAVALARAAGGAVLQRSVFARLPGEGRWETVLLIDGNVGIGGAPDRLLARVGALLRPRGRALVEVEAEDVDERLAVRLQRPDGSLSTAFPWARVGAPALARTAGSVGLRLVERWSAGGRHFARLERAD